jgi:aminopeptidase
MLKKYAELITHYCHTIKKNNRVLIRTTPLATPLLQELYASLIKAGAMVECQLLFESQESLFYKHSTIHQCRTISDFYSHAITYFDNIITIDAPYDIHESAGWDKEKKHARKQASADIRQRFLNRAAKGELQWSLCIFPTESSAKIAGMSLEDYSSFIYNACFLNTPDPINAWTTLGKQQSAIVNYLNTCSTLHFTGPNIDITCSVKDRKWINSDGKRNMPSGEVFTSPIENSVNGQVHFTCPTLYDGKHIKNIRLEINEGYITRWSAEEGQEVLDSLFKIEGSRYFGEIAIGTNYNIKKFTNNILFDEKVGGTIHMAIGASYPETGGKNKSSIHWDLITDMNKGCIFSDETCIYKNGNFII